MNDPEYIEARDRIEHIMGYCMCHLDKIECEFESLPPSEDEFDRSRIELEAIYKYVDTLVQQQVDKAVIKLTSSDWVRLVESPVFQILDPDGWDRSNYKFSWFEERITANEFRNRSMLSTCQWPKDDYPLDRLVKKYGLAELSKEEK